MREGGSSLPGPVQEGRPLTKRQAESPVLALEHPQMFGSLGCVSLPFTDADFSGPIRRLSKPLWQSTAPSNPRASGQSASERRSSRPLQSPAFFCLPSQFVLLEPFHPVAPCACNLRDRYLTYPRPPTGRCTAGDHEIEHRRAGWSTGAQSQRL